MGKIENGKLLYHLTKLSNLDSIIEKGLVPRKFLSENNVIFGDVADHGIMDKRIGYGLDQYVPFHFHPYSAFDVAVKNAFSNEEFVYICIQRELARYNNFFILPKHPLTLDEVILYDYDEGINQIDWDAMEKSSTESDYIHNVRMAECLTEKRVPLNCFQSIAVRNEEIQRLVQSKISTKKGDVPHINIQPWLNI